MKVCHVVNALNANSGPATHTAAINEYTDHEAGMLVWLWADENPLDETIQIDVIEADGGLAAMREAKPILDQYDLVHTHHPHSATRSELLAKLIGIPTIYTYGTVPNRYATKPRIATTVTNAVSDYVTYVSETVKHKATPLERYLNKPSKVVHTGVELPLVDHAVESGTPYESDKTVVAAVGRLEPVKNLETLLEAMSGLEDYELVLAGGGSMRESIERLAGPNIEILGQVPREDAIRLMHDADVFASPSRQEGFATAPLEAMAVGTPVVLSTIPAFTVPFEEELAFWSPVDSPAELRRAIERAAKSDGERAHSAQQYVRETYSMERTAVEYGEIYDRFER